MRRELVKVIYDNTKIMFHNGYITLKTCDMDYILCGMPVWKHCYHMLHSCDRWFINPAVFDEPSIHEDGLDNLDYMGDKVLTREDLFSYFYDIRKKIMNYIDGLSDADLYTKPQGYNRIRLETMIGQMRHFYAHLGNINATTIIAENKWPRVVGMSGLEQGLDENNLYE